VVLCILGNGLTFNCLVQIDCRQSCASNGVGVLVVVTVNVGDGVIVRDGAEDGVFEAVAVGVFVAGTGVNDGGTAVRLGVKLKKTVLMASVAVGGTVPHGNAPAPQAGELACKWKSPPAALTNSGSPVKFPYETRLIAGSSHSIVL